MKFVPNRILKVAILAIFLAGSAMGVIPPTQAHAAGAVITVTNNGDAAPGVGCTLREAIINANANAQVHEGCEAGIGSDTIVFAPTVVPLITLTGPLQNINDPLGLTILGSSDLTINGDFSHRIFTVNAGIPLTLENLRLFYGSVPTGGGGAIYNEGVLIVKHSLFYFNGAPIGGAIYNTGSGVIIIANSTFNENFTFLHEGGAIYSRSSATLLNNTFNNNSSVLAGGDIYMWAGGLSLYNNILANSFGGGNCAMNTSHATIFAGNNLIEDPYTSCTLQNGVDGNIIGLDPALGPQVGTSYIPLSEISPARNAGNDDICSLSYVGNTSQNGVTRPQGEHCDMGSYEYAEGLPTSATFADVPLDYWAWENVETLYAAGITGGCTQTPLNYCPEQAVTRAQMAIFLLRGIHGPGYTPPAATGGEFSDVPANAFGAAWIEQLVEEGITAGCGGGKYCPNGLVTRAQMAIFLLRAKHAGSYTPPPATGGEFSDVPANAFAAAWIEQLVEEGITAGCGGGKYCPGQAVTRAQMAVFLVRTFNLQP